MEHENPFKQIGEPDKSVPTDLKEVVMKNVNQARLLLDMLELFISNYKTSLSSLFKIKNNINTN